MTGGRRGEAPRLRRTRRGSRALLVPAALAIVIVAFAALATRDTSRSRTGSGASGEGAKPATTKIERVRVGEGARAALVVRMRGAGPQPAVIFLHGWRLIGPRAYRSWFAHLARRGITSSRRATSCGRPAHPRRRLDNAIAGVRAALRRVPVRSDRLTVAGHSAGGALAADYAAVAAARGLPTARTVLAIYPGRAIWGSVGGIPAADLSQLPPSTRLVVMASAADQVVGDGPARELLAAATSIPPANRRLVWIDDPAAADHYAPVLSGAAARRVFWRQLDRLLVGADARVSQRWAQPEGGEAIRPGAAEEHP